MAADGRGMSNGSKKLPVPLTSGVNIIIIEDGTTFAASSSMIAPSERGGEKGGDDKMLLSFRCSNTSDISDL